MPPRPTARPTRVLLATAVVALAAGCSSAPPGEGVDGSPREVGEVTMGYGEVLRQLEKRGAPLERGSELERQAIARFQALLGDFKAPDFRSRVREVYAPGVWFNDTLKTIEGVEALEKYLGKSGDALEIGTVEFLDLVVSNGNYYFRWEMSLRFARFDRGTTHRSIGMSHVRFDHQGRVVLHQDFWDSSAGLFEHVPGLGWLLRRAKSRA